MVSIDSGFHLCTTADYLDCAKPERNTFNGQVSNGYPPYSFSNPPTVLKIGGLFSPFDDSGNVNSMQVQSLAAFLLAVKQINNKTDGVLDDILPDSTIVVNIQSAHSYLEGTQAATAFKDAFFGSGVLANVIGASSDVALATNALLTQSTEVSTSHLYHLSCLIMFYHRLLTCLVLRQTVTLL